MKNAIIALDGLTKHYQVGERAGGLRAAAGSIFRRRMRTVRAVEAVSFAIVPGEVVGFLGPNGAGKTTTLKMLAGLLHPTAGTARVLGYVPWRRDRDYLRRMTLVMGNRNQLYWDLPAMDTLLVNQAIYRIPEDQFRATVRELTDAARPRAALDQAGAPALAWRADEVRDRGGARASADRAVSGRADAGVGRDDADAHSSVHPRLQRAHGRDGVADQSLHGRRGGVVPACCRDSRGTAAVRRRSARSGGAPGALQDTRYRAGGGYRRAGLGTLRRTHTGAERR